MSTARQNIAAMAALGQTSSFFTDYMGLVNVKAFGASGDGVKNDTVAVRTAKMYASAVNCTAIYFPHGTYKVDNDLGNDLSGFFLWGDNSAFVGIDTPINQIGVNMTEYNDKFLGLIDAPKSFNGYAGHAVTVKPDESTLIFENLDDRYFRGEDLQSTEAGNSGADKIGMTPIADIGAANTPQSVMEALVSKLKSTAAAAFLGASSIPGLIGSSIQGLITSLKGYTDGHISAINTNINNLSFTGSAHDALVTGSLVDAEGENFGPGGTATYLNGRLDKWEQKTITHMADYLTRGVNVKFPPAPMVAAVGDGVADDTMAIQACLDNFDAVFFPAGRYLVGGLIVNKQDLYIHGNAMSGKYSHEAIEDEGKSVLVLKSDAEYLLDISNYQRTVIKGLYFKGKSISVANSCFKNCNRTHISECMAINFYNVFETYSQLTVIENNSFCLNRVVVNGIVDSRVINNTFNANTTAIYLAEGSNGNIISVNKIEWNTQGIGSYNCEQNIITSNIFDRNANFGLQLNGVDDSLVVANQFRRNSALVSVPSATGGAQIVCNTSDRCIIACNNFLTGNTQDDGSGTIMPLYGIYDNYSNGLTITDNDMEHAAVNNPLSLTGGKYYIRQRGYETKPYISSQAISTATGATSTFNLDPIDNIFGTFTLPTYNEVPRKLTIIWWDESNSSRKMAEYGIIIGRTSGNLSVTTAKSSFSTNWETTIAVTISYDTTNNKVVVAATNNSGHNGMIRCYLEY